MVRRKRSAPVLCSGPLLLLGAALAAAGCEGGASKTAPAPAVASKTESKSEAPKKKASRPVPSAAQLLETAKKYFSPLPATADSPTNPITLEKVALGRILYYDTRLSKNHDLSCNSCHKLDDYGVDHEATSPGHKKQRGERNTPTVYNAAMHIAQFWDGRATDVEDQALKPVTNPVEMALADEAACVASVKSVPGYADLFKAAFPGDPDPCNPRNISLAIGAFERGLTTPAPFDDFLNGNMTALNSDALRGLELFIELNCVSCHTGPTLGGTMYQKLGAVKPYETKDLGRFKVTNKPEDKYVFKVPGLRNVAKTAPYLHDGSAKELGDALDVMAEYQLAKGKLSDEEKTYLIAFLDSLTGKIDMDYIKLPELPASGPDTIKPDPN
ncbi:cytochrome c peroxidase [Nannocystis exedens]|uniref:Cytochrome c peroxidase n=1 Tax=Nannocystis exedens TaxID=54 RepID=A0A1I1U8L4_9BACT|nr:cytochrome-c peroxidase [Nannocystis exedens]SFD65918.1 cytochrome c peroxidase [Nannocystis exedens]